MTEYGRVIAKVLTYLLAPLRKPPWTDASPNQWFPLIEYPSIENMTPFINKLFKERRGVPPFEDFPSDAYTITRLHVSVFKKSIVSSIEEDCLIFFESGRAGFEVWNVQFSRLQTVQSNNL